MEEKTIIKPDYVAIRDLWNREPEFSNWLKENLEYLGEELNLQLDPIDTEVPTDDGFSVDILANSDKGKVAIENQFENSDHKHLGQLLVYMINLETKIGVWICETPRASHKRVIDWLNENSPDDMGFYLIKIRTIKIGDNTFIPQFEVVANPSKEGKDIGAKKKEISEIEQKFEDFWSQFLEKCKKTNETSIFQYRRSTKGSYICSGRDLKTGCAYCCSIIRSKKRALVEIYIDSGDKVQNKKIFDDLYLKKEEITNRFGNNLEWLRLNEKQASRIVFSIENIDWFNETEWDEIQEKQLDSLIKLEKAFKDYLKI